MAYNKLQALRDNYAAISRAWDIVHDNKTATDEDREIISKYKGFGGIKELMHIEEVEASQAGGSTDAVQQMNDGVYDELLCLTDLVGSIARDIYFDTYGLDSNLGDEHFEAECDKISHSIYESLKQSVLTAFYTPSPIVQAVADSVKHVFDTFGIQMQSLLEPSAGAGAFMAVATSSCQRKVAFEKDFVSSLILAALHPDTEVYNNGFEEVTKLLSGERFDVVASNFPFGDNIKIYDPDYTHGDDTHRAATQSINAYFPIKSMEQLENGGILAFITTRYFADGEGYEYARRWMVENGNLLAAVRLPEGTFSDNGTDTGADLIIFQRDVHKTSRSIEEEFFIETRPKTMKGREVKCVNRLLCLPSQAIYTDFDVKANQWGDMKPVYRWRSDMALMQQKLTAMLSRTMEHRFRRSAWMYGHDTLRRQFEQHEAGRMAHAKGKGNRRERREEQRQRGELMMGDYTELLTAYNELRSLERREQREAADERRHLNDVYDHFTTLWGLLHHNQEVMERSKYPEYRMMLSLECREVDGSYRKADIFHQPIDFRLIREGEVLTPAEALTMSLNERGRVDMDYLQKLTGLDTAHIYEALRGEVFLMAGQDGCGWQHRTRLINGNVIEKRRLAEQWLEHHAATASATVPDGAPSGFTAYLQDTITALRDATPAPVPFDDIRIQLGATWLPIEYLRRFVMQTLDVSAERASRIQYIQANNTYALEFSVHNRDWLVKLDHNKDKTAVDILGYALAHNCPKITYEMYDMTFTDHEGMRRVQKQMNRMEKAWELWLRNSLTERDKAAIAAMYNEKFNAEVRAVFDGSYLTFPGLSFDKFPFKDLYQSQRDCIAQCLTNNGVIGWHEVGAGKTMIMVVASYEMHRLGIARKPIIICLKANVGQVADTYRKAYPTARILFPSNEDFKDENRREFFNKIASNDWTCIIMTHDQFERIPQSLELQRDMIQEEIDSLDAATALLKGEKMDNGKATSDLAKAKNNLIVKMAELNDAIKKRKDDCLDFHQLGIDHIFIDECHKFKNLRFVTKHGRVGGLGNTKGSQRAWNMLVAIRDMQRRRGTDMCASFFSGTVVVNALTELYNMFRYLRPGALAKQGATCFDAWASNFCVKSTDYDLTLTGEIKEKERFRTYQNVPELSAFLRQITDFRTARMINIDRPDQHDLFDQAAPSVIQMQMLEALKRYAEGSSWDETILGDEPKSKSQNPKNDGRMLNVTNWSIKVSLDPRLVNPALPDDPDNKASRCARRVKEYYDRFQQERGTQFIFCDKSVYDPKKWNMVSEVRRKLIEDHGIPAAEIAIINQWDTDLRREKLFKALNEGSIRVVFGSTDKLGTGVNAQQRAVAVHHLDIPWRPADLEQRNGRAVRKGNDVKYWGGNVVDVISYGTERTLDGYKYQCLALKARFIKDINDGAIGRVIDEDSVTEEEGMSYAEYVALLSGSQDLMKKAKLDKRIAAMESERQSFEQQQATASRRIDQLSQQLQSLQLSAAAMRSDLTAFEAAPVQSDVSLCHLVIPEAEEQTIKGLGRYLFALRENHNAEHGIEFGRWRGFTVRMRSVFNTYRKYDHNAFEVQAASGIWYPINANGTIGVSHEEAVAAFDGVTDHLQQLLTANDGAQQNVTRQRDDAEAIAHRTWDGEAELTTLYHEREQLDQKVKAELDAKEATIMAQAKQKAGEGK